MALSLGNNTNFLIPQANSPLTGSLNLNSSDSLKLEFTPPTTGYYIFDFSQQENAFTSPAYALLRSKDSALYMLSQMQTFNHRGYSTAQLIGGEKYYLILRHVDSSYYGSYINITISEGYKFTATVNPSGVAWIPYGEQIVKVGEQVDFSPILADDSYMLNNWTKDGNIITGVSWRLAFPATKSNHGEYIANFIKKPPDPVYYEVDLHFYPSNYGGAVILEKGTSSGSFLEGTPITLFANPNLGPYVFQGWYLDSTYAESKLISTEPKYSTVVTKDIDYYAKFQVTNNVLEGQEKTYTVLQEDQRINISYRPTSDVNGKPVIFETTGDVDLTGVLYVYNNGWSSLGTVIKTGEKREYIFPSNANQNSYLLSIVCNEDLDTKKSFNFSSYIKNYNITFIVDNIIYATQKKIYDTNLTLLSETPSKVGHTFKGWGTTSTSTTASYQPGGTYSSNSDLTLYAIWTKNNYTYTVKHQSVSGKILNEYTLTYPFGAEVYIAPQTFTEYVPKSSDSVKVMWDSETPKTILIEYTPIQYSITYKGLEGVTLSNKTSYTIEDNDFTLNNPSKTGYAFDGWTGTGLTSATKTVTIKNGSTGDRTYTANWNNKIFTITLDNQSANTSGTTKAYLKYDNGWYSNLGATTQITAITKPTKVGHTFKGYYTQINGQGDCIINSNGIPQSNIFTLSNTTIYAHWTINYYTLEDDINTNGSQGTYNGNFYSVTFISGDKIDNTYSYGSRIKLIATPNTEEGYNFSYWKINNSYETSQEYEYTIEKDTTITAYFNLGELSITINLYQEGNPNIFNIPMGQEKDYVKLWIRDYNNTSYDGWEQKPFNIKLSYANAKNIQIVIEDGKKYEFLSSDFTQYESIPVNQVLVYSVYFKEISEINSIYLGKSDKPYTSGYIKDPNLSFEEEISSIWVGNKQIMGKAPTRDYPYLEDTLLGNTLYIGKNNSFINSYRDNLNIYKVIVPEGILNTGGQGFFGCSNLTSIILPKSLKSIGQHVFEGTGLKSLYLPDQVETLSIRTLNDMYSLEKIVFPKNLKIIYANNASNSKVSTINLFKTNLEILKNGAFRGLSKLTTILLPNTLQSIEEEAFSSCYNLKKVIYKGTIEEWQNISIAINKNEYLLNATIYCKNGIINPKEEN